MEEEIEKIKISALPEALTVSDSDCFLIVQGRKAKRVKPSLMKGKKGDQGLSAYLGVTATHIAWKLGIDGVWQSLISIASLIGPRGEKPIFKKVNGSLMMKYEGEPDTAYVSIFDREELKMKFSDLTPAEVNLLKLHFADLTTADKAELMKPATEAAAEVREEMIHISQEANQLQEKIVTDAGKVNTDLTAVVNDLKEDLSTRTAQVIEATNTAKDDAITATGIAMSVSDNPGYIGDDYHVYQWDYTADNYVKTGRVLRPEGFSIYRQYTSIGMMEADKPNVSEGKFVLINTGNVEQGDNAQLYVKGATDFEYLVDMSGAIGFTGKTPQIGIGTVTTGAAGSTASASLSPDGTDEDGNPKYKLNQVIPQGIQGFTPELSIGTVTTGLPGTQASVEIIDKGTTESGAPKKELVLTIPAGETGSIEGIYQTREIDHEPMPDDITYPSGGKDIAYPIGAEVYYRTTEEVVFFKLYDLKDGKAVWDEAGSGTALPGNIYLQGATYYNESVTIIKEGYINE